jgi:hypothetical protein
MERECSPKSNLTTLASLEGNFLKVTSNLVEGMPISAGQDTPRRSCPPKKVKISRAVFSISEMGRGVNPETKARIKSKLINVIG